MGRNLPVYKIHSTNCYVDTQLVIVLNNTGLVSSNFDFTNNI